MSKVREERDGKERQKSKPKEKERKDRKKKKKETKKNGQRMVRNSLLDSKYVYNKTP